MPGPGFAEAPLAARKLEVVERVSARGATSRPGLRGPGMVVVTRGSPSQGGGARGELLRASTSPSPLQQLFRMPDQVLGASWLPAPLSAPDSVLPPLPNWIQYRLRERYVVREILSR